jgi:hypothetical protein
LSFQEFRTVLQERQKQAETVKKLTDGTQHVWFCIQLYAQPVFAVVSVFKLGYTDASRNKFKDAGQD